MRKMKNSKGFTLMEMLIVVAIIAVLVAVMIPTMTSALEKSREAADLANTRSAYAQLLVAGLTEEDPTAYNTPDGIVTYSRSGANEDAYVYTAVVKLTQKQDGWKTTNADTAVAGLKATGSPVAGGVATVTYTVSTGKVAITYGAANG